ncbi:uncharacterized protein P174DRAFT_431590 [Aspergillus novofumigatus IBT 16806]|uniref:Dynamin N-terminal domain-containing protein n=1 Tax=Aspergillus novofumigatus (strain IBT 16806) TaxID=1392255 RepID=A0A2I1CAM3_ASPN1|nr:uncharacterized protein P174DRAFT_431590 [Aspergillus novofumigatus IBT 16806]PKX94685.1 hypothetical protein P174DRAFT_431590 [Aspergillus novofumigatus IBT 16806]
MQWWMKKDSRMTSLMSYRPTSKLAIIHQHTKPTPTQLKVSASLGNLQPYTNPDASQYSLSPLPTATSTSTSTEYIYNNMNTTITGSMQQQQVEFQVPAEQTAQHGMESTFPSELAMCHETLSVKEADERADGRVEQSGESHPGDDMAAPVSALEAAIHVPTGDTDWGDAISGLLGSWATGAGKSSLINAIIDEKGMLVTNCMRAATEVAYNDGPRRYKAEVHFIQLEEWNRELEIMCHEMLDENPDINAIKTTREKIKAVYAELDNGNIADTTMGRLLGHPRIAKLLGSSFLIEEDDPRMLADKLKPYIDSKSGTARKDAAQALSTGAVLVDLPGLYDSNAARVAVADDYLKRCAAHWIVAPINRAVDDKIAQSLVNKHLKSQMIFDCICDSLTFICTKTDDISVTEVQMSLALQSPSFESRGEREGFR